MKLQLLQKVNNLIFALIFTFFCTNCTDKSQFNQNIHSQNKIFGVDISHHNQVDNYDEIKLDFVILKATEGLNYKDPTFKIRNKEFKKLKIPVGAYHFFLGKDGYQESYNYMFTVNYNINIIPIIDVEKIPKNISKEKYLKELELFILNLRNNGYNSYIIYTSENFYKKYLESNIYITENAFLWFGDINKTYESFKVKPDIHQYAIKNVSGFKSKVDCNIMYIDIEKILLNKK